MTGMEHAIEQAARVLIAHPSIPNHKDPIRDVCPSCPDADVAGPNSPSHAAHQARALAEAGWLAPAPLTDLDRIRAVLDKCADDTRPGETTYVQTFDAYEAAIDAISRIAYPEARNE